MERHTHCNLMSWPPRLYSRDRLRARAGRLTVRDEHYTPFQGSPSEQPRLETVTVFVMARLRRELTDSMRRSLRAGPHGWDAVYTLNGELYRSQWFAAEASARTDLATHQELVTRTGWQPVPFQP
jgi:hypothetical protein